MGGKKFLIQREKNNTTTVEKFFNPSFPVALMRLLDEKGLLFLDTIFTVFQGLPISLKCFAIYKLPVLECEIKNFGTWRQKLAPVRVVRCTKTQILSFLTPMVAPNPVEKNFYSIHLFYTFLFYKFLFLFLFFILSYILH